MTHSVTVYAGTVADNFKQQIDAQPEDQLKFPVGNLLRDIGQQTDLEVNWRTEVHPRRC